MHSQFAKARSDLGEMTRFIARSVETSWLQKTWGTINKKIAPTRKTPHPPPDSGALLCVRAKCRWWRIFSISEMPYELMDLVASGVEREIRVV